MSKKTQTILSIDGYYTGSGDGYTGWVDVSRATSAAIQVIPSGNTVTGTLTVYGSLDEEQTSIRYNYVQNSGLVPTNIITNYVTLASSQITQLTAAAPLTVTTSNNLFLVDVRSLKWLRVGFFGTVGADSSLKLVMLKKNDEGNTGGNV